MCATILMPTGAEPDRSRLPCGSSWSPGVPGISRSGFLRGPAQVGRQARRRSLQPRRGSSGESVDVIPELAAGIDPVDQVGGRHSGPEEGRVVVDDRAAGLVPKEPRGGKQSRAGHRTATGPTSRAGRRLDDDRSAQRRERDRHQRTTTAPRRRRQAGYRVRSRELLFHETTEKGPLARAAFRRSSELAPAFRCCGRLLLCGGGAQGGSDRVEVDEDGGPDGLER
jgi:hypothetical protein